MAKFEFGFIGCGNMGGALIRAIAPMVGGEKVLIADMLKSNTAALHDTCGVCVAEDACEVAASAKYIFLGVKPQGMRALLESISGALKEKQERYVLISMAAGITVATIREMVGTEDISIIRILPNTPAAVGKGMTLYCCNEQVTKEEESDVVRALRAAGEVDCLEERLIDAGCAVSGCGPAFVYLFMEALADGAVAAGLPRQKAMLYAAQTVLGASEMLLQSGKHPGELKDAVCSPGGSTICGVNALEQGAFRATVMRAVLDAYEKTKSLGNS
jgi:pyrroline-5-carboxylate reductase